MDINISELFAAAAIITPVVGGVWFAVRNFVTDLTGILRQYADRQAETLRLQHDIGDLLAKHNHLRNSHKQLSVNVHSEFVDYREKLKESDDRIDGRLKENEAQLNRVIGLLEGMNYGRRHDDD